MEIWLNHSIFLRSRGSASQEAEPFGFWWIYDNKNLILQSGTRNNMKAPSPKRQLALVISLLSLAVFAETSLPYWVATHAADSGHIFLGQVFSTFDQNMYYSFIRQAFNGHNLMSNHLTYLPNEPAFFNLEFWTVGNLQRILHTDENGIFTIWRFLGALSLTAGFAFLARPFFADIQKTATATTFFLFAGGLSFLYLMLFKLGRLPGVPDVPSFMDRSSGSISALDSCTHLLPYNQILCNPNIACATGLVLVAYGCYFRANSTTSGHWVWVSALLFGILGFVRPYDVLPAFAVLPLCYWVSSEPGSRNLQHFIGQMLPLLAVVPSIVYDYWLFHYHDTFRSWSEQGNPAELVPGMWSHFANFGGFALLALARVACARSQPLNLLERQLLVWFGATFLMSHAGAITGKMCWSFQIGGYMAAPLALLGLNIKWRPGSPPYIVKCAGIALIVAIAVAGNWTITAHRIKEMHNPLGHAFATTDEWMAYQWLQTHSRPDEVVFSSTYTSSRIAKYTDLKVVLGHPFVTPHYKTTAELAEAVATNGQFSPNVLQILHRLHADYIFAGPDEKAWQNLDATGLVMPVYSNSSVRVYRLAQ